MLDGRVAKLLQPIVDVVTTVNDSPVPWTAILTAAAAALGLCWAVLSWRFGGSMLKVELELGYTDGRASVHGSPRDFDDPGLIPRRFGNRITNPTIDVAVVTVRNRGRTAATVLNPSLRFTQSGVEPVVIVGMLIPELGEDDRRVRVEAHDSRVFAMPLAAMVAAADQDIDFQKALGSRKPVRARAQVTSGTGRVKRSPILQMRDRRFERARWTVRMPLRGREPSPQEQLVSEFYVSSEPLYDQFLDAAGLLLNVSSGKPDEEIVGAGGLQPGEMFRRMKMLGRAVALTARKDAQ